MAFLASLMYLKEMERGLSPLQGDGNGSSETALGHTRSAPKLLTATTKPHSAWSTCLFPPCSWWPETGFVGYEVRAYSIYRFSLHSYPNSIRWGLLLFLFYR